MAVAVAIRRECTRVPPVLASRYTSSVLRSKSHKNNQKQLANSRWGQMGTASALTLPAPGLAEWASPATATGFELWRVCDKYTF